MYQILNFPVDIGQANSIITSVYDHVAFPPDYEEGFEERKYQYSKLGLTAFEINNKLRILGNLPIKNFGEWDSPGKMKELYLTAKNEKELREKSQRDMWDNMVIGNVD
jgi:hypothetical protein